MSDSSGARLGVSLAITPQVQVDDLIALGLLAEARGYESVWIPETWGVDAVSLLAALAVRTQRIVLASGVFNVYSRSAAVIAQTVSGLQHLSDGRFRLGLGSSGPIVVERWHGVPFRRPVARTRAYVEIIRLALSGAPVSYRFAEMSLAGFRLDRPWTGPTSIWLAALGPRNVRLAGEVADGWLPIFAARGRLAPLFDELGAGLASSGRSRGDIEVAAYLPAAMGPGAEGVLRRQIAYYVGGMGTFYAQFMEQMGFGAEARRIHAQWQTGERRAAVAAVPEEMLELCCLGPDAGQARSNLSAFRAEGVQLPVIVPVHGASAEVVADVIERLAPEPAH